MNAPVRTPVRPSRRRRALLGAAAALIMAVLAVLALAWGGTDGGGTSAAATRGAARTPVPVSLAPRPATPAPTGPTGDANALPPSLPAVPIGKPAAVGNGIGGSVASLEAINGTGRGPGNVAGPALRVTIRITNGTAAPVSLDGVAVDLTYGTDRRPASPLEDPSARPFTGTVHPGDSAVGVYVFTVPADDRAMVTVSVGYQAGAPFMVFTGSAG